MLEFLGLLALISICFGISMGEALGGLVKGFIWVVAICSILGFIGGLYSDIKNGVFRESEEHKKKRLAQEEAQKKAQEEAKKAFHQHKVRPAVWIGVGIAFLLFGVPMIVFLATQI